MTLQDQAEQNVQQARLLYANGRQAEAVALLRRGVLQLALVMRDVESSTPQAWQVRGEACRLLGDYLTESEEYPEAAISYQDATDCYTTVDSEQAEIAARDCAARALSAVSALQSRPEERLHLLTARYERQRLQLALEPETEAAQAECCVHIAQIFQRRDRPEKAVAHYEAALNLYALTAPEETGLACAECHHRIAGLCANVLEEPNRAIRHYRLAIALYTTHEPFVEGEQTAHALCVYALNLLESP